jgi:hypothetical protein
MGVSMGRLFRRLAIAIFLLSGCQRADDFLHHILPDEPDTLNFTHKLKELVGESRVDILWVIDNSASMGTYQQAVIHNADLFIQEFVAKQSLLDWKMGIVSTDDYDQPYVGFNTGDELNKHTVDPVAKFTAAVRRLGTSGSGLEKPFLCAQKALNANPTFLRKNAILALIVVTDAPDQSNIPGDDMAKYLVTLKGGNQKQVVYYGVLGPEDWSCTSDGYWNFAGSAYEVMRPLFTGKDYPLCSPDFGKNLADLGKDLVKKITAPRITLQKRPQVATIKVKWHDQELKGGLKSEGGLWLYDFDLNAIVFHDLDFAANDEEEVVISFEEALSQRP